MGDTIDAMQSGAMPQIKFIALIEGCELVLSDCADESAVQAALAGTDWENATVTPWLRVELKNEQSISPLDSFIPNQSRCLLRVADTDGADTFGTFIHRRLSGAESPLTATVDRNDTTINVASTTGFASFGTIFIGTEAIVYGGVTATSFTGCVRGVYSPFTCGLDGSGGSRFANHHRVGNASNYVAMQSVVSQLPRTWMGKRVGVWLHTWDGTNLNTKAEAQLLYAGRLVGIADDPNTFETVLDIEPAIEEIRNGVIGKDMWNAVIPEGLTLVEGRRFQFQDWKHGTSTLFADEMVVVASGATAPNEINAGVYSLDELTSAISSWLSGEQQAARINGFYSWHSPTTGGGGVRTKCFWHIDDASDVACGWKLEWPGEVASFLGIVDTEPGATGMTERLIILDTTNEDHIYEGKAVPYKCVLFHPYAGGRVGQEFNTESSSYETENERGTFVDQYTLLPAPIKSSCTSGDEWGLFLLDDRILLVGTYDAGTLKNCWLAPFQLTADKDKDAVSYIGRRADDQEGGPISIRQVFLFESSFTALWMTLLLSTGTSGYNDATYDASLGYGLGLGIPGDLIGPDMLRSVVNLPGADAPLAVFIDEPTKFEELFSSDLKIRRSFVRWKNEKFEMGTWQTPVSANAVGTLTEDNKAEPSSTQANHRTPTQEAQLTQRPIVKFDFERDFATGRDGTYLKSVSIEDQTAVDDLGGNVKPETIKMRNSFAQFRATGAAVEAMIPGFMAFMPCTSRPWRALARSIDLTKFESISVGDVLEVEDNYARDPVTGARGIARPAVVTKVWYDLGGNNADGTIRQMAGGVELMYLDAHRSELYGPSADVDDTESSGGYSAGYLAAGPTLRCYEHHYSNTITITTKRGGSIVLEEEGDATHFDAGDKILIVERDPANVAAPVYWEREVLSQTNNDITLTSTLSSPAWSPSARYRIVFQKYSQVQTSQKDFAYQADATDYLVEDTVPPYHPDNSNEPLVYVVDDGTNKGEFVADMMSRDGGSYDVGTDRALAYTINAYNDAVSLHHAPCLWNEYTDDTSNSADWFTLWLGVVFLGTEHLSTAINRFVTISPWFRSASGGDAGYIRVTLSRSPPVSAAAEDGDNLTDGARFIDAFTQSEWTTTSSTWSAGTPTEFSLAGIKDLSFGYVFVTIEKKGYGQTRGLARFSEGAREST